MRINVHIAHLLLDGVRASTAEQAVLATAVAAELTRLITANGLAPSLQSGAALPSLPAAAIQLTERNNAASLGEQIAQAVYGGIGNGNENGR